MVRIQTGANNVDALHIGGLRSPIIEAGCTDTCAPVLHADQEPDEEAIDKTESTQSINNDREPDEEITEKDNDPTTPKSLDGVTNQEPLLEIIERDNPGADKTTLAHLIRRTLSIVGFSVKLTDSENDQLTDEIQTLRLASTIQHLTESRHRIHIRTALVLNRP